MDQREEVTWAKWVNCGHLGWQLGQWRERRFALLELGLRRFALGQPHRLAVLL